MKDPLVPAEVDLRDFGFMPLDVRRLLTSETWIEAADSPKVGHAVMCLWAESWHQVPAASIPDNDKVLARLAMCDLKTWKRIRDQVLAGWVKCNDGLLYHPTVAEKALESWKAKQAQRERTRAATEAREQKRRAQQEERDEQRNVERNEQRNVERDSHQGIVKGQGQGDLKALPPTSTSALGSEGAAGDLARALGEVGFPDCSAAHPDIVAAAAEGIKPNELKAAALDSPGKGIAYIVQRARGRRADAAKRSAQGATATAEPVDPAAIAAGNAKHQAADEILKAENDLRLGLITPEKRDQRVAEARARVPQASAVEVRA